MKEEAFFLYLTYSLSQSPRYLWFLTAESIDKNGILTYWDPALDQYREIILESQTEVMIKQYEIELKPQIFNRDCEERISNDRKTVITDKFLFNKKPTCNNNLFRNGFKGSVVSFSFTPSEVMSVRFERVKKRDKKRVSAYLPLQLSKS